MPDEDMIVERPSRRAAAVHEPPPQPKRYRVLKEIVVRQVKYRPGDVISKDSAHPKLNWDFCLHVGALEEVK